ncbi:MAG: hypothetical protein ACHQ1H_10870 [Nitrososphaerales archaeon]
MRSVSFVILVVLGLIMVSSLSFTNSFATRNTATAEKVSIKASDQSYVNCYCWDVALIKGTVHTSIPISERKVTVYCECVCNYSLVRNEQNYYPGVNLPCIWYPNVGWHALLTYDSNGKLVPYMKTNANGAYKTIVYDFQNSNTTAPYYGTSYHFYALDDTTHMKSFLASYLAT